MHQDADANLQKVKLQLLQRPERNELAFLAALSSRQLGSKNRSAVTSATLSCAAEDELIKKELSELSCSLPGAPRSTFLMEFSPDGTKVASTHGNHQIYVSDVRSGKHIKTLVGHPRTPWCIAFHPTSNQIIASGCLGGQVRIWDLSGGSEVWTAGSQSVIASIAFHPNDRLLVIATFNELFFWDWSRPEPFTHVSTANAKEKVRYVAFDKLGHKLITGITNNPQTRWERVCTMQTPMPPPEPYLAAHRRALPRPSFPTLAMHPTREPLSSVPERERRITNCYHELVQQYEMLVHRYLQIYRRPVMIDQGTDPMEVEAPSQSVAPHLHTQGNPGAMRPDSPVPSTSGIQRPPPRKSSASHPAKNRKWRSIFQSDSADSSSSGSSKGKTPRRPPETPPLGASIDQLKTNPDASNSSSDDDADDDKPNGRKSGEAAATPVKPRQYTKVRQLKINTSRADAEPAARTSPPMITMPVKFFTHLEQLISNQEANGEASRANASSEAGNGAAATGDQSPNSGANTTALSPSTIKAKLTEKRHLTNMINSAKLFVSKYKEMFQQLGIQVRDLPDPSSLPSTSGISIKPSKSTNTSAGECESQPQRKRRMMLPQDFKDVLYSSSEVDTSSDEEPQSKVARVSERKQDAKAEDDEQSGGGASTVPNTEEGGDNGSSSNQTPASNVSPTLALPLAASPPSQLPFGGSRLLSHRLSAFRPTYCPSRFGPGPGTDFRPIPIAGNSPPAASSNFAQDEVINYAERDGEEQQQQQTAPLPIASSPTLPSSSSRAYHPFDPPPDVMSINPENIGIGSMYSNIVQELESTLNDVRNIRFRLGEMSDMLGNISDRLENIMVQSNTILRNLNSSLEELPAIEEESAAGGGGGAAPSSSASRPRGSPETAIALDAFLASSWARAHRHPTRPFANSDHTYPLNPEASQNATLSPLHVSLQWTVTHIQRQATQLRQQVESIERIDRAMIEVAQLQMIRQMLDELHVHFGANHRRESRLNWSVVSSVRQMMAGTRISDPQPATAAPEAAVAPVEPPAPAPRPTMPGTAQSSAVARARTRKNNPRCLFFMHRQFRRSCNPLNARTSAKQRPAARRNFPRRAAAFRGSNQRTSTDICNLSMARRLEHHLLEHSRYIGRASAAPPPTGTSTRSDVGEHVIALRLNNCRCRMNRIMGQNAMDNLNVSMTSVTVDGTPRFGARQALITTLDSITRYTEANAHAAMSSTFRSQIWEIIELSLLLAELLLLQIVDSIPPLSGMNLDPERENLSLRIDQMCFRMIHNRFVGQSHQLTRSLRQLRHSMRTATEDLGRTYTARRNAMLPAGNSEQPDSRQSLLDNIQSGLRTLVRLRNVREQLSGRTDDDTHFVEWYRSINEVINRYAHAGAEETASEPNAQPSTSSTTMRPPTVIVEDASSSDDNSNGSPMVMRPTRMHVFSSQPQQVAARSQQPANHPTAREAILSTRRAALLREMRQLLPSIPMTHRSAESNQSPTMDPVSPNDTAPYISAPAIRLQVPRQGLTERLDELRSAGHFRPRFLHPWYNGSINPFDDPLDDNHRESIYESDMIPTATPNHRIQVWSFADGDIPNISDPQKNVVVSECKIHNDASVDYSSDGKFLVTLLPAGGYLNITNRLGIYSMEWDNIGELLFVTNFDQNAVSVSLSPTNRHLVVGLATRRVSILPAENMPMARIFHLPKTRGNLVSMRVLEQCRESTNSINCIRWLPVAGQGLIFGTNTGHLKLLS